MTALSPSTVIGLRNALTGEARALRVRQLTTPSCGDLRPDHDRYVARKDGRQVRWRF